MKSRAATTPPGSPIGDEDVTSFGLISYNDPSPVSTYFMSSQLTHANLTVILS